MIRIDDRDCKALWWVLSVQPKSHLRLEAENLALQHQLNVLCRRAPRRFRLRNFDRFLFVWLYRLWPGVRSTNVIARPDTVVRWRKRGFGAYWRWQPRGAPGRPRSPKEIRALIHEVRLAIPLWGALRVHGALLLVEVDIAQPTVAKYMVKGSRPPSQSWKTFPTNHAEGIASIDFLRCSDCGGLVHVAVRR